MKVSHNENEHYHTVYELADGSKILVSDKGNTYLNSNGSVIRNSNTRVRYFMQEELNRFLNKAN